MNFMKERKMGTYFDIMSLTEFLPLEEKIGSSDFEYLLVFSSSSLFQLSTRPEKFIRPSNGSKIAFQFNSKEKMIRKWRTKLFSVGIAGDCFIRGQQSQVIFESIFPIYSALFSLLFMIIPKSRWARCIFSSNTHKSFPYLPPVSLYSCSQLIYLLTIGRSWISTVA